MAVVIVIAVILAWLLVGYGVTCWVAYVDKAGTPYGGMTIFTTLVWPATMVFAIVMSCQWIGEGRGGVVGHIARKPFNLVDRLSASGRRK